MNVTTLQQQYDAKQLAEMVVELEAENDRLQSADNDAREWLKQSTAEFQKLVRYVRARDYNARHDVPKYAEEVAAWQALAPETRKAIDEAK